MELVNRIAEAVRGSGGITLVIGLVFVSVLMLVFAIASIMDARARERRRLLGTGGASVTGAGEYGSPQGSDSLASVAERLDAIASVILPKGRMEPSTALRREMIQAGLYSQRAVRIYYLSRLLLAVGLGLATIFALPILQPTMSLRAVGFLGIAISGLGFYVPAFYLSRRTRKRQTRIREGFPDALDLLLVCVESGLGIDSAIARVSQEIGRAHPLISEQFGLVSNELRVGRDREEALRALADRIGIDEVSSLVSLLVQTDKLGTSMAAALRAHAEEMRSKRMLRAEEKAYKLPVKLSGPLVFFILPALLLVILSPAALEMSRVIGPAIHQAGSSGVLSGGN
ncbi:MAG TPA: type II secretion system F family protein [Woeseiaceae bacterium]|nr:type II secretion system F family protein [Woeseiaceae bacterium]